MKKVFYNLEENRLRAGWRILIFITVFWLLAATIFLIQPLFGDITKRAFQQDFSLLIVGILAAAASISVWIARKFLDKKSFLSLGLQLNKRAFRDTLFGFLLSAAMAGLFFTLLLTFNLIEFNGFNFGDKQLISNETNSFIRFMKVISIGSLALLLLEHILVGYWEELVFRGYLLQNMIEGMGGKLAVVLSCLIYGLIHASNPNAGLLSTGIIMIFGLLRIYGYTSTKMLWLSIGMHIGWNFFQGPIFGFAASGHQTATLFDLSIISDYDWLTGGDFGPEGSVIMLPIIALALLAMNWYAKKQIDS